MWSLLVVLFAGIGIDHSTGVKLHDGAVSCRIDSPDRDECLRSTIQRMIPHLSKGQPTLRIPALDPLVRNATLYEFESGPLHALVHAKTTTVYGVSKTQVEAVRTQITDEGMSAEIDMYFPRIFLTGAYKAESSYDAMRMNSKGVFNMTFTGLRSTQTMSGHFVRMSADNSKFVQLDNFGIGIDMDDFELHASGIFAEPELNQLALSFANEYWRPMYKLILPGTKSIWEPMILEECNRFLSTVPLDAFLN